MKPLIKIFENKMAMANKVAKLLFEAASRAASLGKTLNIALSGGSTPKALFEVLANQPYKNGIPWKNIHFFWSDERCVPPGHPDSNYGLTKATLLDHIDMPATNIHRIVGEAPPISEASRYAQEIRNQYPTLENSPPQFDWIFLGMGQDGHTASLFPATPEIEETKEIATVAVHPVSGQKRISFTLTLLNAARRVTFLITGADKKNMVDNILNRKAGHHKYPAALVIPDPGFAEWYLDKLAAQYL